MTHARKTPWAMGVVLSLAIAFGGCQPAGEAPSDEATMAVLGTARALHHEADLYESAGNFVEASRAMERILAMETPRGMQETEDLRADAYGRLSELDLRRDAPDDARAHAQRGIDESRRESVLRARLFMVQGQALGVLADRATAAGDLAGASARRAEALAALDMSIQINQRVLGRLTDGGSR